MGMRKFTRLSKIVSHKEKAPEGSGAAPRITVMDFNEKRLEEKEIKNIDNIVHYKKTSTVSWIDIEGIENSAFIDKIAKGMGLHPIVVENIINKGQRPKIEDFGDHIFLVLKMIYYDELLNIVNFEHVSVILAKNYVMTFQEGGQDVFDNIRKKIRGGKSRIRKMGNDYLVYSLIDAIVENYFTILEKFGEKVEVIEENIISSPRTETLKTIHELKREMLYLRKSVWPLREVVDRMEKSETPLIKKGTAIYLRSVYEHTIQIIDTAEILRETLSGILEIYLSSISNKLNEVMKVLTVIATIFMPLTFMAGIYGMNFRNMPELDWTYGYPAVLLLMLTVGLTMLIYFWRRGWV